MFLLPHPQGQESAEGAGETGQAVAPHSVPEGRAGRPCEGAPGTPIPRSPTGPRTPTPGPGHYCFFAPTGGGGRTASPSCHSEPDDRARKQSSCEGCPWASY